MAGARQEVRGGEAEAGAAECGSVGPGRGVGVDGDGGLASGAPEGDVQRDRSGAGRAAEPGASPGAGGPGAGVDGRGPAGGERGGAAVLRAVRDGAAGAGAERAGGGDPGRGRGAAAAVVRVLSPVR